MAKARTRRSFGAPRKLQSGRWQARYTGPDGAPHKARKTFATKMDADAWLSNERRKIDLDIWDPPELEIEARTTPTFRGYAERWYTDTAQRHAPRTTRRTERVEAAIDDGRALMASRTHDV